MCRLFTLLLASALLSSCHKDGSFSLDQQFADHQLTTYEITYVSVRSHNFMAIWEEEFELQPLASKVISPFLPDRNLKAHVTSPPANSKFSSPAIFIFHGGAFIPGIGSFRSQEMINLSKYYAARGFVAISVEYRDANLLTPSWIKAGYCATQDAKAALQYFANHHRKYNIDPESFYLTGISAGAITALNAAFLEHGESIELRQEKLDRIYGRIDGLGEQAHTNYAIKGVLNICGAAFDLDMIDNAIPVVSVHGTKDKILPYACGMPFEDYSLKYNALLSRAISALSIAPTLQERLKQAKSFEVCGGSEIHLRLLKNNTPTKLITLEDDHNVFFGQSGVLTTQGEDLLKTSLTFFQKNL